MFNWLKNLFKKKEEVIISFEPTPLVEKLHKWVMGLDGSNILLHLEHDGDDMSFDISERDDDDNKLITLVRKNEFDVKTKRSTNYYAITKCSKKNHELNFEGLCQENTNVDNEKLKKEMWYHCRYLYKECPEGIEFQKRMKRVWDEYDEFVKNF